MLVRAGFVSNSSTTSFLISRKNNEPLTIRIEQETTPDKTFSTIEQLNEYWESYYGDIPEDEDDTDVNADDYYSAVEEIKAGNIIQLFEFSNSEQAIALYCDPENIELPADAKLI